MKIIDLAPHDYPPLSEEEIRMIKQLSNTAERTGTLFLAQIQDCISARELTADDTDDTYVRLMAAKARVLAILERMRQFSALLPRRHTWKTEAGLIADITIFSHECRINDDLDLMSYRNYCTSACLRYSWVTFDTNWEAIRQAHANCEQEAQSVINIIECWRAEARKCLQMQNLLSHTVELPKIGE